MTHRQRGQHAEALALFRKTMALRETLAHDNPENRKYKNDIAAGHVDIGLELRDTGQSSEALSRWKRPRKFGEALRSSIRPSTTTGPAWPGATSIRL